jgi:hypothetical protein
MAEGAPPAAGEELRLGTFAGANYRQQPVLAWRMLRQEGQIRPGGADIKLLSTLMGPNCMTVCPGAPHQIVLCSVEYAILSEW